MLPQTIHPYTKAELEIIKDIIDTRPEGQSQRQALFENAHRLPGRTIDGIMYRYQKSIRDEQLADTRKAFKQSKPKNEGFRGGKAGTVFEHWRPDEDAILWNAVQTRPSDKTVNSEIDDCMPLLPGRTRSSILNRYYGLKKRFEHEEAPELPEQMSTQDADAKEGEVYSPASSYSDTNLTVASAGAQVQVFGDRFENLASETPPAAQQTPPAPPVDKPTQQAIEATPRLAERAEEFIRSLYSVVEENKELRNKVQQLEAERAQNQGKIEADLEAERTNNTRLRKKIYELEEDQQAFLKLMDKARVIGRQEVGI